MRFRFSVQNYFLVLYNLQIFLCNTDTVIFTHFVAVYWIFPLRYLIECNPIGLGVVVQSFDKILISSFQVFLTSSVLGSYTVFLNAVSVNQLSKAN